MTDAKQEALKQALHYYYTVQTASETKKATPEQVIATAKKFELFLDPHAKSRR